jgi:uncharacterized membrane protein YdbT with pleckstrin-like domain
MSWRDVVLRFLRVPPSPTPPPGSTPRVFRAASNYYYLRLVYFFLTQIAAIAGFFFAIAFLDTLARTELPRVVIQILRGLEIAGIVLYLVQAVFAWTVMRLDYELRWYMVSDRAIRIREGIATVKEKTIALANIQNLGIRQGPLQRLLGIADVEVKTAGGGESSSHQKKQVGEPMHVAYFRGVDNAVEIRDLVREGVRRQRNSGLGDPEERDEHREDDGVRDAVRLLLDEARALRQLRL